MTPGLTSPHLTTSPPPPGWLSPDHHLLAGSHLTPLFPRETNNQFWLANAEQLSVLETSLLRLVQRTDSTRVRCSPHPISPRPPHPTSPQSTSPPSPPSPHLPRSLLSDGDTSSGRESVTTVISNSSSETLRNHERHSSSETLRWGEEEVEARGRGRWGEEEAEGRAVRGEEWGEWSERPSRRLLARSRSEAGAALAGDADFGETGRPECERRGPQDPNSHLAALQKAGGGGRGAAPGAALRPLDGATWGRGEEARGATHPSLSTHTSLPSLPCSHCRGRHGPTEGCGQTSDMVSSLQAPNSSAPSSNSHILQTPHKSSLSS